MISLPMMCTSFHLMSQPVANALHVHLLLCQADTSAAHWARLLKKLSDGHRAAVEAEQQAKERRAAREAALTLGPDVIAKSVTLTKIEHIHGRRV